RCFLRCQVAAVAGINMKPVESVNLFLLGAPKCGTTAMAEYLGQHPEIFFPRIKEPHYFCTDFPRFRRVKTMAEYRELFAPAKGKKVKGDASVWNLYSRKAIGEIRSYNQESRILIMVRDPVSMLPSLHNQLLYSGREDIAYFDRAWRATSSRKQGV